MFIIGKKKHFSFYPPFHVILLYVIQGGKKAYDKKEQLEKSKLIFLLSSQECKILEIKKIKLLQ